MKSKKKKLERGEQERKDITEPAFLNEAELAIAGAALIRERSSRRRDRYAMAGFEVKFSLLLIFFSL